jgi:hypothetical protein
MRLFNLKCVFYVQIVEFEHLCIICLPPFIINFGCKISHFGLYNLKRVYLFLDYVI